jgi:hypothetical protein
MVIDQQIQNYFSQDAADPRLLDDIGRDYAMKHGVLPLRRVGALTLVAARDMWARLETIDHLEERLGPITFVPSDNRLV